MAEPRGIEERIRWFLTHDPAERGMCARHTWQALGGDRGNPPAWDAASANLAISKVIRSGHYWAPLTWPGAPPRGAWVGYRYGVNGHACLSLGDGRIATTDPSGPDMTGVEPLSYPNRWGARGWTLWTDEYNGVRFAVGGNVSNLSEKETKVRKVRTNQVIKLDIGGVTQFAAGFTGWADLASYANLDLPPSGSEARVAINRGGIRTWFQQTDTAEADGRDETGYDGPWPPPVFGEQRALVRSVWPHTVDRDLWEFCIQVYAFDATGKPVDIELGLATREVKIVAR